MTRFSVGDEVYGDNLQRWAASREYAIAPESVLAHKPAGLTFAAGLDDPAGGCDRACREPRARRPAPDADQRRGRWHGAFAIPLAKAAGAHVTGVDNAGKLDFMRSLGADAVIDYRVEDFTRSGPYDLILDLVAHRSVFAYRRALAPGGRYLAVGGTCGRCCGS